MYYIEHEVMKELPVSRDPSVVDVVHSKVCNSYSAASLRESWQLRREILVTMYTASESLDMKKLGFFIVLLWSWFGGVVFCLLWFGYFSLVFFLRQIEDKC